MVLRGTLIQLAILKRSVPMSNAYIYITHNYQRYKGTCWKEQGPVEHTVKLGDKGHFFKVFPFMTFLI